MGYIYIYIYRMGKCCSHGMEMAIYVLQHITGVFFHIIRNEIIKIYFPFWSC